MKFRFKLCWKVLLRPQVGVASGDAHLFFNRLGGKSFVRSLGGDFRLETAPDVLAPTDLFHQALRKKLQSLGASGNRFPYSFFWPQIGRNAKFNISIHWHGGVLCATVKLEPFEVEGTIDWLALQDLKGNAPLWKLTCDALALARSNRREATLETEPQVVRAIHIQALDGDHPSWQSDLASLVTTHRGVTSAIVDSVLEKNLRHQIDESLLLIDKQGVAAYVPKSMGADSATGNWSRFECATAMLQLAAVFRLQLQTRNPASADVREAILRPNDVVTASVTGRHMWNLFVQEFALPQLLVAQDLRLAADREKTYAVGSEGRNAKATSAVHTVLLMTVTEVETREIRSALSRATGREPTVKSIDGFTYSDYGVLGDFALVHQISGMGSGGLGGSQESVRRSISAVRPDAVLMAGIAFGIDPKKQPIGTILVSKKLQTYELQRVNNDASIDLRGDNVPASPRLLNWLSHAEVTWPSASAKVKSGLILSGEKLIDNQDFRDQLLRLVPEAIGGEMEGAGLYAASQNAKVDWLLVKAVCDWADGNKSSNKAKRQTRAARSAADFVVHMLKANSEAPT